MAHTYTLCISCSVVVVNCDTSAVTEEMADRIAEFTEGMVWTGKQGDEDICDCCGGVSEITNIFEYVE